MSTQLLALPGASISTSDSDSGALGAPTTVDIPATDPKIWIYELLTAVDLFLSPQYAVQPTGSIQMP